MMAHPSMGSTNTCQRRGSGRSRSRTHTEATLASRSLRPRKEALAAVEALALRVVADRIENGELQPEAASVLIEAA